MDIIGSARSDESKKYAGGKAGDWRQTSTPDMTGEVSQQKFYVHSKGWYILRVKDPGDCHTGQQPNWKALGQSQHGAEKAAEIRSERGGAGFSIKAWT